MWFGPFLSSCIFSFFGIFFCILSWKVGHLTSCPRQFSEVNMMTLLGVAQVVARDCGSSELAASTLPPMAQGRMWWPTSSRSRSGPSTRCKFTSPPSWTVSLLIRPRTTILYCSSRHISWLSAFLSAYVFVCMCVWIIVIFFLVEASFNFLSVFF